MALLTHDDAQSGICLAIAAARDGWPVDTAVANKGRRDARMMNFILLSIWCL